MSLTITRRKLAVLAFNGENVIHIPLSPEDQTVDLVLNEAQAQPDRQAIINLASPDNGIFEYTIYNTDYDKAGALGKLFTGVVMTEHGPMLASGISRAQTIDSLARSVDLYNSGGSGQELATNNNHHWGKEVYETIQRVLPGIKQLHI